MSDATQALAEAQRQRAGAAAALRALDNALERMRAERALAAETAAALAAALAGAARRSRAGPAVPMADAAGPEGPPDEAARHTQGPTEGDPLEARGAVGNISAERGAHAAGALARPLADAGGAAAGGCAARTSAALQRGPSARAPAQHAAPAPASARTPECPVPGHGQAAGQRTEPEGPSGQSGGEGRGAVQMAGPSSAEVADVGVRAPRRLCEVAAPAARGGHAAPEADPAGGRGSPHRAPGDLRCGASAAAPPRFLTLAELAAEPLSVPLGEPAPAPDQAPGAGARGAGAGARPGRAPLLARGPCRAPDQARRVGICGTSAEREAACVRTPGASGGRPGKENAGGVERSGGLRSSAELSALLAAGRAHARCSARAGVC